MLRIARALACAGLILAVSACVQKSEFDELKDKLNTWAGEVHTWHTAIYHAVCQLEVDVYMRANSGGDTREPGPPASPGSNRICPDGDPGDPGSRPPPPPPLF